MFISFTTLWATSADHILVIFSDFSQTTGFDFSCKLFSQGTICTKRPRLFSDKKTKQKKARKNITNQAYCLICDIFSCFLLFNMLDL